MSKRLIIPLVFLMAGAAAPLPASAGTVSDRVASWLGVNSVMGIRLNSAASEAAPPVLPVADAPATTPMVSVAVTADELAALAKPISVEAAALPEPSTEKGIKHFYCVEYARLRSGMAMFGDAKTWWNRAKNLYGRIESPVQEAVIVFSGSRRLSHGHVAVVTDIVSPREIRVDQANWQNHGEIDHSTPVLDVSAANDWSKVRVWDVASHQFGSRIYAISGFIVKGLTQQASN